MCLNYPAARFLHGGGSNIITIRREPHCQAVLERGRRKKAAPHYRPQGLEAASYQLAPVS